MVPEIGRIKKLGDAEPQDGFQNARAPRNALAQDAVKHERDMPMPPQGQRNQPVGQRPIPGIGKFLGSERDEGRPRNHVLQTVSGLEPWLEARSLFNIAQ